LDSRTALGKEFGTKKSQKRLRALELNKIDVSDMGKNITTSIVSQVEANTKDMPTAVELGNQIRANKPIPKVNHDAKHPNEVYNLEDIIGSDEYNVIWVREWERGEELKRYGSYISLRPPPQTSTNRKLKVNNKTANPPSSKPASADSPKTRAKSTPAF